VAAEIAYNKPADTALRLLEADPAQAKVVDRIYDALDLLEADPGDQRVRRRRFRPEVFGDPPLWGIPIHGIDENWLILWADHITEPGVVVIHYIGPDI
jgi:hypothetical protein